MLSFVIISSLRVLLLKFLPLENTKQQFLSAIFDCSDDKLSDVVFSLIFTFLSIIELNSFVFRNSRNTSFKNVHSCNIVSITQHLVNVYRCNMAMKRHLQKRKKIQKKKLKQEYKSHFSRCLSTDKHFSNLNNPRVFGFPKFYNKTIENTKIFIFFQMIIYCGSKMAIFCQILCFLLAHCLWKIERPILNIFSY